MMNISKAYCFDAVTRRAIFGHEDATQEDADRLFQCYIKKKDYETVSSDLPFCIVVGKKGTGKSATLKYSFYCDSKQEQERFPIAIWVRATDITEMYQEINSQTELDTAILLWKKAIAKYLACRLAESVLYSSSSDGDTILNWAYETGYKSRDFISQIANNFQVKLKSPIGELSHSNNIPNPKNFGEHHILGRILKSGVCLYIDDVDRGWKSNPEWATKIKALIAALGDMTSDLAKFKARISLRTVVYDYICQDTEFMDKYQTSIVRCKWENAEILKVLISRIVTFFEYELPPSFFDLSQKEMSEQIFPPILCTEFKDTRVWNNRKTYRILMSLVRGIPRDMVKLLNAAAQRADESNRKTILPQDICSVIDEYSIDRLEEIAREFCSELPCIKDLLLQMGPTKKEKKEKKEKRYLFKTSDLLKKISEAMDRIGKASVHFSEKPVCTPLEIANFLYKIGFITARKDFPNQIFRTNYEKTPHLLTRSTGDKGYSWEIHPAYRAALYTYDPDDICWESTVTISDEDEDYQSEKTFT